MPRWLFGTGEESRAERSRGRSARLTRPRTLASSSPRASVASQWLRADARTAPSLLVDLIVSRALEAFQLDLCADDGRGLASVLRRLPDLLGEEKLAAEDAVQ